MRLSPHVRRVSTSALASLFLASFCLAACDDESSPAADDVAADVADASDVSLDVSDDAPDVADSSLDAEDARATPYTDSLILSDRFLNIAHRGGGALAPEETLEAFSNAVEVGADVLELDVHSSSDGVLVVMHDNEVDRTTDGTGLLHELTFEQLRALDAGYNFTTDGGTTYPYRGQGVVIPTLEEVLTEFPEMYFIIEVKQLLPSISADVVALIEELEMESQVCVSSFSAVEIHIVREANPDLITGYAFGELFRFMDLNEEEMDDYVPLAETMQIPPEQGNVNLLDPAFLERAHHFGIKVQVWTVNDRTEMESMVTLDLDGIITDDPETLTEVIEASGVND